MKKKPIISSDLTDDPNAPKLFDARAILIYGTLFSVFAGSILMALNFFRLDKSKEAWTTLLLGFGYSALQILVLQELGIPGIVVVVSYLGMYLLTVGFWNTNKPIGLKHQKRNIWPAVIIALAAVVFLVALLF